jgi:hypothetical protein
MGIPVSTTRVERRIKRMVIKQLKPSTYFEVAKIIIADLSSPYLKCSRD